MKTLAIEQSTRECSVALLDGDALAGAGGSPGELALPEMRECSAIQQRSWQNEVLRNQAIFTVIPELLAEVEWRADEIALFAVGLGPGSFAGVRTALAAAEGFAMVDRKPIMGIGSGEAIVCDLLKRGHAGPIAVVGDARRRRLWVAVFEADEKGVRARMPYALVTEDELGATLGDVGTVATPDWDRIGDLLSDTVAPATDLVRKPRVPCAATVGRLALASYSPEAPPPLPQPIYLHPAVFVKPNYGKTTDY